MFREMRRKNQLLSKESTEEVLKNGSFGVLAVSGDGGYPYAVPISYVYEDGTIYFHCAKSGHKLDAIRRDNKVSFCVVDKDQIVPEKFTTYFRSAIAFGYAEEIEDEAEKLHAMRLLDGKYSPGLETEGEKAIQKAWGALSVVKIQVEHLTGKEAIELVKLRNGRHD